MTFKNLKPIGIFYFILGNIAIFSLLFELVPRYLIISGILIFMLYFLLKGLVSLFRSNVRYWVDFAILWGISLLLSAQVLFLLSDSFKVLSLVTFLTAMCSILILNYRYKKESDLPFFLLMQFLTMGSLSANF
jgi:hypothetical protein